MPPAGRKPNDGTKPVRHRVKPVHDWLEVERVRFEGAPKLPGKQPSGMAWPKWTRDWWKAISTMPHCSYWDDEDWRFAIETAVVAAEFHSGNVKAATELRQREAIMGTTYDARMKLRIRYVEPAIEAPKGVTAIDKYRRMVE